MSTVFLTIKQSNVKKNIMTKISIYVINLLCDVCYNFKAINLMPIVKINPLFSMPSIVQNVPKFTRYQEYIIYLFIYFWWFD
jgi:hypothetical protein